MRFIYSKDLSSNSISDVAARQQTPYSFDALVNTIAVSFAKAFINEIQKCDMSIHPEPKHEEPSYLTRQEAASRLRVSLPTFHAMVNAGLIAVTKAGKRTLVEESKFEADLASGKLGKYCRR